MTDMQHVLTHPSGTPRIRDTSPTTPLCPFLQRAVQRDHELRGVVDLIVRHADRARDAGRQDRHQRREEDGHHDLRYSAAAVQRVYVLLLSVSCVLHARRLRWAVILMA